MSSIAMDNNGSIGMAYLKSNSSTIYPSLCYTGRRTCDALGTLPVTEVVAKAGTGSQTGTNRDGDYAQTVLDPVDGITFWHTGEYMGSGGNAGTQIFSFQITPCAATVAPVANFSGASTTICAGSSVAFTDLSTNTPTSWSWSFPGGTPSTSTSQNPTVVYSTPGNYSVTLTATNSIGSSAPVTITNYITVNPLPVATVSANSAVCPGATVAASAFTSTITGTTYAWTNSNTAIGLAASGTGNVPSFTAANTTAAAITATITVTPTANGCAGAPATYTITVNPKPTVSAITNVTACAGTTVAASAFASTIAGSTFAWTNTNTAVGLAASGTGNYASFTATNTTTANITATVSVTATSAAGCASSPLTYTVTVNPLPTVTAPTSSSVCAGGSVTASAFTSTVTGTTYAWTNSNTAIGLAASGTGNTPLFTAANTTSAPISGTITVTPTASTCAGTAATYTITVNPTPTVTLPANQTVCNGATTAAINFAGAVTGTTFAWTNNNIATGLAASGTGNIASFTATNTTTAAITSAIVVTPTANGCTGSPQTFLVTVNPAPAVTNSPLTLTICSGDTASFVPTSNVAGTTFSWTAGTALPGVTGMSASGTGNISDVLSNSNPAPGFATYTITPIGPAPSSCAGTAATLTVTVEPVTPTPTIATAGMVLTSSSATGNQWYLNGSPIAGATSQTYTVTANGSYTVVVTAAGCSSAASTAVVITTVGIADNSIDNSVMIYPNPSSGVFTVELLGNKPQSTSVKVFDVLGQLIYQSEITTSKGIINLSAQAEGVYFIQLKTATGTHTTKVLKQ